MRVVCRGDLICIFFSLDCNAEESSTEKEQRVPTQTVKFHAFFDQEIMMSFFFGPYRRFVLNKLPAMEVVST